MKRARFRGRRVQVKRGGGMLSYQRVGAAGGTPVVFLHGIGISSWMWRDVVAELPELDALLIDLPGHGDSAAQPWRSLAETAQQVVALLDRLGLDKAQLVGLSLGGYVALEALAQSPTRFSKAVISGVHAGGMPNQGLMVAMSVLMAPLARLPFFAARTARMLAGPDADIAGFQRAAAKTRVSAFRRASIDATRFELPQGLSSFEGPLTVCYGAREHELIVNSAQTLAQIVPNTRIFVAENGGHGWPAVQPKVFAQLVRG